jgi:hypothetical protein
MSPIVGVSRASIRHAEVTNRAGSARTWAVDDADVGAVTWRGFDGLGSAARPTPRALGGIG